jgi:hypothetical protein
MRIDNPRGTSKCGGEMNARSFHAVSRFAIAGLFVCMIAGPCVVAVQGKASELKQRKVGGWTLMNVVLDTLIGD